MQEQKEILKYHGKEIYEENRINEKEEINKKTKDYYEESINALIQYMEKCELNPSEKRWNKYATDEKYLSGKTMGYLSGIGFNTLCRKLRKEINKKKRQIRDKN